MEIRNIAIIAHVDHGKTTLTDALMRQTGVSTAEVSMDSNALEQERGITIYAKNTSIFYPSASSGRAVTKINIVDTPGHADFGSEVERVLRSIDSVLLVVDAQEGPMPQTRFVLKKSLELGLKPIVVINKIDKPAADPAKCEEQVLELFLELGANDEQADFPVVYAIGRQGIAKKEPFLPSQVGESDNLNPLLDTILEHVKPASSDELEARPLRMQPFNLGYDNFLGRLAVVRIYEGKVSPGQQVFIKKPTEFLGRLKHGQETTPSNGETRSGKLTKVFTFEGIQKKELDSVGAGDIVMVAGLPDIYIGETITGDQNAEPLPAIAVDEPTITLNFLVNNSPFAGREGKFVTSRQIREYLERELEVNVGLRVDFESNENFKISGRGELHIVILLENMRRAGYELQVSQPQAIIKEINGSKSEPFEEVVADIPTEFLGRLKHGQETTPSSEYQGVIIEGLSRRGFRMKDMRMEGGDTIRLSFEGPTRGFLGYRNQFIVNTKGRGILSSRFLEFRPMFTGSIEKRTTGSMISMANGKTLAFAIWNLQDRGALYIHPNTEVYEGMVIGNTSKGEQMDVNPTKGKQLTNMRASGSDESIILIPPVLLTIERGLEIMSEDEYLEITPKDVRLRKQHLTKNDRARAQRN